MEDIIIELIIGSIDKDYEIRTDTNLRSDVDIDSFDFLMIINALEDEFDITIDEDDFAKVNNVNDIAELLHSKYEVK